MPYDSNTLAKLAEELRVMSLSVCGEEETILDKAYRIVDEMAKPDRIDGRIAREIITKCRAIAEEGNGK